MTKKEKPDTNLFTIGHSNYSLEVFGELLSDNGIGLLIDVRSKPYSRYMPHFNKTALHSYLNSIRIKYRYGGEYLGGMNGPSVQDDDFIEKMNTVVRFSNKHKTVMMCSERDPRQCHRAYKLSAWVNRETEIDVVHIVPTGNLEAREFENSRKKSWLWHEYGGITT